MIEEAQRVVEFREVCNGSLPPEDKLTRLGHLMDASQASCRSPPTHAFLLSRLASASRVVFCIVLPPSNLTPRLLLLTPPHPTCHHCRLTLPPSPRLAW